MTYLSNAENHLRELTPKSWTSSPTKGVLFYEQAQYAVQAKGSSRVFKVWRS